MVDDVAVHVRERRGELRRSAQRAVIEVRVQRVEELIPPERPRPRVARGPLVCREELHASANLPVVRAAGNREGLLRLGERRHRAGAARP